MCKKEGKNKCHRIGIKDVEKATNRDIQLQEHQAVDQWAKAKEKSSRALAPLLGSRVSWLKREESLKTLAFVSLSSSFSSSPFISKLLFLALPALQVTCHTCQYVHWNNCSCSGNGQVHHCISICLPRSPSTSPGCCIQVSLKRLSHCSLCVWSKALRWKLCTRITRKSNWSRSTCLLSRNQVALHWPFANQQS